MINNIFNILIEDNPHHQLNLNVKKAAIEHLNYSRNKKLNKNIQSFKNIYPDAKYYLFDNSRIIKFLKTNFDSSVLETYLKLKPFAFKADLAKFCILFIKGGMYSDLSYFHVNPLNLNENTELYVFRDIGGIHPPWSVSSANIYSKPNNVLLEKMIEQIIIQVKNNFYGTNPLEVTGPYLFGKVLASNANISKLQTGESILLPNYHSRGEMLSLSNTGQIISYRNKKIDSSIEEFTGYGNNYLELWSKGDIYNDS